MGDVVDTHAIKIALEQVVALEGKVRVGKGKLCDQQVRWLWNPLAASHTELPNNLVNLRIVGIRRSQLKRVRLFNEQDVLDAEQSFARVIDSRCKLCPPIIRLRPRHPRPQSCSR